MKPEPQTNPNLTEPLTRREREVLALLADLTLTNAEIAGRLFLSIHAIKWNTRNIYAKLGVSNRRAALQRARELGLLDSAAAQKGASAQIPVEKPNLPAELTSFVGRRAEIEQILALLADPQVRLLTIAGPGGAGKTRLALKLAQILADEQGKREVYLLELAGVSEPARVLHQLALALGLLPAPEPLPIEALVEQIQRRPVLLLLDNCEHLVEFGANLALGLLKHCPGLHILVTSREVFGVEGEQVFWLSPLSVPPTTDLTPTQAIQYESIHLFVERAKSAQMEFALTTENTPPVIEICRKLDGLPLAIELAATRVRMMSVDQIEERLADSLNLLSGNRRAGLPQHKTLRASIEWSFDLLSPAEQILLVRLSIFGNEWSLETAEAVCSDEDSPASLLPTDAVLQTLCGLVEKSLVTRIEQPGPKISFRLLASIRQFAYEKREALGLFDRLRRRYLAYLLDLPVDDPDLTVLVERINALHPDWDPAEFHLSERVMRAGLLLAHKAGLAGQALLNFRRGAVLHDLGKLCIPAEILLKPGPYDDEEWRLVKRHPIESVRLLEGCPGFQPLLDIPACHHEFWDGSGYPRGLRGEEIPLSARLFCIVDHWEALSSDRPHRMAWPEERVLEFLEASAGTRYDPALVPLFIEIIRQP